MEKTKISKGNAFGAFQTNVEGIKNFDTAYKDVEVKKVPKKVGTGQFDYIMEDVVIEHTKDIREYINSQSGDVGVYAFIDRAARGLVDIEQATLSDAVVDMSNAPTTLMEAAALGDTVQQNFAKLPDDLKQGKGLAEFLASVSPEDIIKYYANKAAGANVEVKEEIK